MRKIISLITVVILFSACKKSENTTVSNTSTTKTDSSSVDHSAPVTTSNSGSLLDLFTKRKDEIVLKLKSISAEQANALYEKYHEENGYLLHQIDEKKIIYCKIFTVKKTQIKRKSNF